MTRIIAGFAGSLALSVPASGTRPTSDRVREAVFSALDARDALPGARVLDLYAGSGALGLEAASRGASSVDLVERNRAAATIARSNATRVRNAAPRQAAPHIVVHQQSVQAFLDARPSDAGPVDAGPSDAEPIDAGPVDAGTKTWQVVFIDPPYDLSDAELAGNLRSLAPRLAPDAIVVLERGSRSAAPILPDGLELERQKSYGDTTLWWLRAFG